MIKGGFQGLDISGVDLTAQSPTLPGGYAACQAADGKTVLVLTPSGAVQCSVKKVSTNYVLAGITGDGKILSITIGSTDGISVSETTIPSGGGGEEADVVFQNYTDISTYTESTPFTAPNDGILKVTTLDSITAETGFKIKTPGGFSTMINFLGGTYNGNNNAVFIRKGSIVAAYGDTARSTLRFYEYKPVES